MLILALLRRCESLPICDRTYVIERRSRTRRISYESDGGDARRRFGLRFRLLSYVGVFLVTAPSCGFSEI